MTAPATPLSPAELAELRRRIVDGTYPVPRNARERILAESRDRLLATVEEYQKALRESLVWIVHINKVHLEEPEERELAEFCARARALLGTGQ